MKTLVLEFKKLESGNAAKYSRKKKKKKLIKNEKKIGYENKQKYPIYV